MSPSDLLPPTTSHLLKSPRASQKNVTSCRPRPQCTNLHATVHIQAMMRTDRFLDPLDIDGERKSRECLQSIQSMLHWKPTCHLLRGDKESPEEERAGFWSFTVVLVSEKKKNNNQEKNGWCWVQRISWGTQMQIQEEKQVEVVMRSFMPWADG